MCKDFELKILNSKDWLFLIECFGLVKKYHTVFFVLLGEYEEALKVMVIASYFQVIFKMFTD